MSENDTNQDNPFKDMINNVEEPLQTVIRNSLADKELETKMNYIFEHAQISREKHTDTWIQCLFTLCGVSEIEDLKDKLIADADLSYEQAVKVKSTFKSEIYEPLLSRADMLPQQGQKTKDDSSGNIDRNTVLYSDHLISITPATITRGRTTFPTRKIKNIGGPIKQSLNFGGDILNLILFLVGCALVLSMNSGWMIGGLVLALLGGFNIYSEFHRPYILILELEDDKDWHIQRQKQEDIKAIHEAFLKAMSLTVL